MIEAEESGREKEISTKGVGDREKKCVCGGGERVHLIKECFSPSSQPSEMMTYKIEMCEKVNLLRSRTSPIQSQKSMECLKFVHKCKKNGNKKSEKCTLSNMSLKSGWFGDLHRNWKIKPVSPRHSDNWESCYEWAIRNMSIRSLLVFLKYWNWGQACCLIAFLMADRNSGKSKENWQSYTVF